MDANSDTRPYVPTPVLLTAERKARRDGWAVSVLSPDLRRWRYKPHQVDDLDRSDHLATVYRDGSVELVHRDPEGNFEYLESI